MRPCGGIGPTMMNYANGTDVYRIWADMIVCDESGNDQVDITRFVANGLNVEVGAETADDGGLVLFEINIQIPLFFYSRSMSLEFKSFEVFIYFSITFLCLILIALNFKVIDSDLKKLTE